MLMNLLEGYYSEASAETAQNFKFWQGVVVTSFALFVISYCGIYPLMGSIVLLFFYSIGRLVYLSRKFSRQKKDEAEKWSEDFYSGLENYKTVVDTCFNSSRKIIREGD